MSESFVTLWTVAHQAPLSMRFPRLAISLQGDLPDSGVERTSPVLAGRFFSTEPRGSPWGAHTSKLHAARLCKYRSLPDPAEADRLGPQCPWPGPWPALCCPSAPPLSSPPLSSHVTPSTHTAGLYIHPLGVTAFSLTQCPQSSRFQAFSVSDGLTDSGRGAAVSLARRMSQGGKGQVESGWDDRRWSLRWRWQGTMARPSSRDRLTPLLTEAK